MPQDFTRMRDEGSNSPFVARMFVGILEIRDLILMTNNDPRNIQITRQQFDKLYEPIRNSLEMSLISARTIAQLHNELRYLGLKGELIKNSTDGGRIFINNKGPILKKEFHSVVEHASIAIKTYLPKLLTEIFGFDIGFLYQKEKEFHKRINELRSDKLDPLGDYLFSVRFWTNQLIGELWNQMKHTYWKMDDPKLIVIEANRVHVLIPEIIGTPIDLLSFKIINRCCLLVEDLIVYGFQFHRSTPIIMMEIESSNRKEYGNKRFTPSPKFPGMRPTFHEFVEEFEIS